MDREDFYLRDNIRFNDLPYAEVLEKIADEDKKLQIEKRRVIDLEEIRTHSVPTDCFADDDTIVFLAEGKENANRYGLFLRNKIPKEARVNEVTVYHQKLIECDKSRGLSLRSLVNPIRVFPNFICCERLLWCSSSLLGVCEINK